MIRDSVTRGYLADNQELAVVVGGAEPFDAIALQLGLPWADVELRPR